MSFVQWLFQRVLCSRDRQLTPSPRRVKRRFVPRVEELEPRVVPAYDITMINGPTMGGISTTTTATTTTFTAIADNAELSWTSVSDALTSGKNVVINSGSGGTQGGSITNNGPIGLGGFSGSLTLTFQSGSGTGLVGDMNLGTITTPDSNLSIVVTAAGNVTTSDLAAGTPQSPTQLASVQITTTGGTVSTISGGSIYATDFAVQAKGNIGSSGSSLSTNVGNLVAKSTTGGIYINNTGNLNIGYSGEPFQGVSTKGGDINLTTGVGNTFTVSGTGEQVNSSGGNITIAADSMVISDPVNAGAGAVTLEQATTTTRNIVLGGTTAGNLAISNADLAEITANALRIGRTDNAGSISVVGEVDPETGFSTMHLFAGTGGIAENGGFLDVSNLAIDSKGTVTLSPGTFYMGVSTLAANVSGGNFSLTSADPLTIGTVDGDTGVTDTGGSVTLGSKPGLPITLAADVTSTTSTVDITAPTTNVALSANVTLTGTTVTLHSPVMGGGNDLTVTGNADFQSTVSTVGNLSVSGTTDIYDNISTTKTQTYTGAVTLDNSVILTSTGTGSNGNINFQSTVDGVSAGGQSLTVNTAGTTTFGGAVGGGKTLGALTTDAGGNTQINGGSVNTTGFAQTYNDNVTLGQTFTLLAGIVNFNAGLILGNTATTATSELQIAGTLNFASTTTVTTTFAGTSPSQVGHILVGGGNTTYGNATLDVIYAGGFTPAPGNSFDVVSNGGFGIGQFVNAPAPGVFSFSGVKYSAVYNGSAGGGDFIMTVLSANDNYIEALYQTFLGRPGTQAEWDSWAALLPSLGRTGVVGGIEFSSEACNRLVNQLYLQFLNRPATGDPDAQYWVNLLVHGGTEEQVSAGILSSSEFAARANTLIGSTDSNSNFVHALYQILLNRPGEMAGLNDWINSLNTGALTRVGVALGFLDSPEYRTGAVDTFYGNTALPVFPYQPFFPDFLHRAPAAWEVNLWVSSPLALLSVEEGFAASNEFYNDNS